MDDLDRAERQAVAAEARLGQLPAYVRERFIDLLVRGERIPPLPGEACFREADWLKLSA